MVGAHRTPGQTVAANVKRLREARGLSQRWLGEHMAHLGHRWGDTIVSRVERGEREVTAGELLALALVLGIEPVALLAAAVPGVAIGDSVIPAGLFNDWVKGRFAITLDPDTSDVEGIQLLVRVRSSEQNRPPSPSSREELREFFGDVAHYVGDEEAT